MKQILVQWSQYYWYKYNEANISVTSAIKQILVLRVQSSKKFTIKFTISVEANDSC